MVDASHYKVQNMPSKKVARFTSKSAKALSLLLASSCLIYVAQGAQAAGLGKLRVLSSLGQPLRAEIELISVTKADIGNLSPQLANTQDFRHADVEYSPILSSLQFAVEERGLRHFVLITSAQPINEPYMELLVELTSSSGRLLREYAMLLSVGDVGTNHAVASAGNQAPASILSHSTPATDSVAVATTQAALNHSSYYQIKGGDTLSKIAKEVNYPGISLDQMLVAILRSNASAVIADNMNLIRSGVILTIPDINEVKRIDKAEATKIVIAQAIEFNAYREKLANQIGQAEAEKATISQKIDSGKIKAKVTEVPTPINESKDKLQLSRAQLDSGAEEEKIAKQKALEIANARLKELEKNTANLQKVLDLQEEATSTSASIPPQKKTVNPEVAASVSKLTTLPTVETHVPALQKTAKTTSTFFDNWARYLPYAALLIGLLAALGIYSSKRKKKIDFFDDEANSTTNVPFLLGSSDIQSAANNSVVDSTFDLSPGQLVEEESDPITKADTNIAHGHDELAEEILKEALRAQPERQLIRIKLLEIYTRHKDILSFGMMASELYEMTGGIGADWAQATVMGRNIDPQNPLYANKHVKKNDSLSSELVPEAVLPEPETTSGHAKLVQVETNKVQDKSATSVGYQSLDLDTVTTVPTALEFDLSGIDLELPKLTPVASPTHSD